MTAVNLAHPRPDFPAPSTGDRKKRPAISPPGDVLPGSIFQLGERAAPAGKTRRRESCDRSEVRHPNDRVVIPVFPVRTST